MNEIEKYLNSKNIQFNNINNELFIYLSNNINLITYNKSNKFYIYFRETRKVKTFNTSNELLEFIDTLSNR